MFPSTLCLFLALALGPTPDVSLAGRLPEGRGFQESGESSGPSMDWQARLRRDARVSFTRRSAHDARLKLESGRGSELERCLAMMAIGCTEPQPVRDRPLLESFASTGSELERCAALLALGEFGEGGDAALLEGLEDPSARVRGSAMIGLLRGERRSSRLRVEAVASADSPDAPLASALLATLLNPAGSSETEGVRLLLDLRWGAATRYGLVDDHSWKSRLIADLLGQPLFLDSVVLGGITQTPALGVKDHLMTLLLAKQGDAELRAATVAMPDEMTQLIEAGLWQPRNVQAWEVILSVIERDGSEVRALGLLNHALAVPEVAVRSLRLIVRAGIPAVLVGLEEDWVDFTPREKELACQAWALGGDVVPAEVLLPFREDPSPGVRANVRVAGAILGDPNAHEEFRSILRDQEHEDFAPTLRAALQNGAAPLVRAYLEELLTGLEGAMRLEVATSLALNGVSNARLELAFLLRDGFPPGARGARCIRALTLRDPAASMDLFIEHFPVEDDLTLNVALASAIVAAQHNSAYDILRRSLWQGSFDMSVLAAGVLVRVGGIHTLRDELNRIPLAASSNDLRRIGFALGEWGGLRELEYLKFKRGLKLGSPVLQGALLGALGRRTH